MRVFKSFKFFIISNKIILISDTGFTYGHVMRELLKRKRIIQYFSRCFFSDEIGHYKPHSKPFQMAESFIQCKPVEMVHIGDRIKTDIVGANRQGWWSGLIQYSSQHPQKQDQIQILNKKNKGSLELHDLEKPDFIIHSWDQLEFHLDSISKQVN